MLRRIGTRVCSRSRAERDWGAEGGELVILITFNMALSNYDSE